MADYISKYEPFRKNVNFIKKYQKSANAASGSEVDANSNVSSKNIATMAPEVHKKDNIYTNRLWMHDKLLELYGQEVADKYLEQLENHEIYRHDESGMPVGTPYCASITLYPFLFDGMTKIGGTTTAPKHLKSFVGGFINLVFAVSAQLAGAVATPEFLSYMDYFIRLEYGDDYYTTPSKVVTFGRNPETIGDVIDGYFNQVVYSMNQPAAARGSQSVFWNVAYFDSCYFHQLFDGFVFPDGSDLSSHWDSVSWLQKRFMKWFNKERTKNLLTFPVETVSLLNDGNDFVDKEWADFVAEMYAEGHSFFTYTSDSVDSLASCCRLRNGIQDNTFSYTLGAGGVSTGSKCVMTINMNRLVQNAAKNLVFAGREEILEEISKAVAAQTELIHKYLFAFNEIVLDMQANHMISIYDAGFVSPEKQYLTVGVNGVLEGAEYLGIDPTDNEDYQRYIDAVLTPIYELNKRDKTKAVMFNTEFVPKRHKISGHVKPFLMDSKLSLRQRGASVMAA